MKITTKCTKHKYQRLNDKKVVNCRDCQRATIAAGLIREGVLCSICGYAPGKQFVEYNGALVWACGKKAHGATARERQELKQYKRKLKLQKKAEELRKQYPYEQVTA